MASVAYGGVAGDGMLGTEALCLPYVASLNGKNVEVDSFRESEWEAGRKLMNDEIIDGRTWPFENVFEDLDGFRGYYLSHAAFIVRATDTNEVLGSFYIKPNFPGRCNHICNGGFIVNPVFRGNRTGTLMGACFLDFAKKLGYKASYFNLVFESNTASVKLWESLGFNRVATIPNAARLNGLPEGVLDTAFGYHFDLDTLPADYDPVEKASAISPKIGPYIKS